MSRRLRLFRRTRIRARVREQSDPRTFAIRHRFVLVLLWAQVPALAALGLARGASFYEIVVAALLLVVLAVVGMMARNRAIAAGAAALGLVTAAGILVRYLDGSTESQFAFFIVIVALSFYQDWPILLLGWVYVATYHLIAALIVYREAFTQNPGGADAVAWPAIHLTFTLLLTLLLMSGWRLAKKTDARGGSSSEDGFRLSFEKAPIGMAVLTTAGEFVHANEALTRILGYETGHLLGANIRTVIHSDDLDDLGRAWEEMGFGVTRSATAWIRCRILHGQAIGGRIWLSLVPRTSRRPPTVLLQLEEATEAYHQQRGLESLLMGKDEFVAAVGEEIREPIGSILELTAQSNGDRRDLLEHIGFKAKEIASIVDDLVVSARADTIPVSVMARRVDAGSLCEEALAALPGAENVLTDVTATTLWADPVLVKRIVSGLVGNALRYGGSVVRLETTSSGPDTVIQVIDDGPEIPLSERERIFSGDLRNGQPVTRPAAVGLGLTVARHLARQMDGDLDYRRTGDGHNVFELRLPSEQVRAGHDTGAELEPEPVRIPA